MFLGKLTKNPNLKINYLLLFNKYIIKIVKYNRKTIALDNYVEYEKNISF